MELRPLDRDPHPVPLAHLQMDVVQALLDEAALAALERPEHQVVLFAVEADGEVIAVRLQIEQNAGALVELPAEEAEADGDLAVLEIVDVPGHRVREVRV